MTSLRVSIVQYLNTAPLIWGMLRGGQRGRFEMDFTTPARCADAVREGRAAAGIIPSIELQRIDNLRVAPGVTISSLDAVRSVILISKRPIQEVRTVGLDTSSRTSAALVTILLRKFYGLRPELAPAEPDPESMLRAADAALLIGDPALVFNSRKVRDSEPVRVYDLGTEWNKFTGLPFVFAIWAGPESAGLGAFAADLQASRDYGIAHMDEIAGEYAPRLGLTPAEVKFYLTHNIHYNLEERHREALDLFYRLAFEEGLIPAAKPIQFV
ncbi:MAG: menaquinone biosynthetic enzyme MqnA/MqnD family protein [Terriglobia bacterium]